jgi:hypothetical protein
LFTVDDSALEVVTPTAFLRMTGRLITGAVPDIANVTSADGRIVPIVTATAFPEIVHGREQAGLVSPSGSVSITATFSAEVPPMLPTVKVYVSARPPRIGSEASVLLIHTSGSDDSWGAQFSPFSVAVQESERPAKVPRAQAYVPLKCTPSLELPT